MIVKTISSTYEVTPMGSFFKITKVSGENPKSVRIAIDEYWVTTHLVITIGSAMIAGGIITSVVESVEP